MSSIWKWGLGVLVGISVLSLLVSAGLIARSVFKHVYVAPITSKPMPVPETFNVIAPKSTSEQASPPAEQVKNQQLLFYQNQKVDRISGTFVKLTAGNILEVNLDGNIKWFLLDKDTKLICQPGGYLNTDDNLPAGDVFIEDKTDENIGIPWGIEITPDSITSRVTPQSETQVYFRPQPGSLTGMPKVVYIWFKQCN